MPAATRDDPSSLDSASPRRNRFATTRWSVVLRAGRDAGATGAAEALAHLCQTYWFPLYAEVRRRGYGPHDAQDLTQAFFARLLAGDLIARADPARGRFRSLVLTALKYFLADERDRTRAQKRGGAAIVVSIDADTAEQRFRTEPSDHAAAPDQAFDRHWAVTLLATVLAQLEEEYRAAGKARQFSILKETLIGARESQPYAKLATALGANEGAVKVAVHRLRRRYRELLEAEIAQTVSSPAEAAAELNHLFRVLAGK